MLKAETLANVRDYVRQCAREDCNQLFTGQAMRAANGALNIATKFILFIVVTGLSTACGTIVNGSKQKIYFDSEPPGAGVTIRGNVIGQTPGTVELIRNSSHFIQFSKEGYELATAEVQPRLDHYLEATLGNIWNLFIGVYIDVISGGAFELEPDHIKVKLNKSKETSQ
jgi:PEGA domain-containing protein